MQTELHWLKNHTMVATNPSGHNVVIDVAKHNAPSLGCRPMELLLMGLGGCTAYDVLTILEKSRQTVDSLRLQIRSHRAESVPHVFERITVDFYFHGELDQQKLERAIRLSAEKYCSASIMLAQTAKVNHQVSINGSALQPVTCC